MCEPCLCWFKHKTTVKLNDFQSISWYENNPHRFAELLKPQRAFELVAARAVPTCVTMECLRVARLNSLDSGSGRCCSSPGRERGRPGPDWGAAHHSSPFPSVWCVKVMRRQQRLYDTSPARWPDVHLQLKSQSTPFPGYGPIPQRQTLAPPFSWINPICFPPGLLKTYRNT